MTRGAPTPGPWLAHETASGTWHIVGARRVVARCDTLEPDSPRMRANAHLIAAAPDLLEAAKGLTRALHSGDEMEDEWAWFKRTLEAIARARGEES